MWRKKKKDTEAEDWQGRAERIEGDKEPLYPAYGDIGGEQQDEEDELAFHPAKEKSPQEVDKELEEYMAEDHSSKKASKSKKIHKKWSKKRIIIVIIVVLLALFVFRACAMKKQTAPVMPVTLVTKGDVTATLALNGPISAMDSADVVSNIHAEVQEIYVKEGDKVEKGQTLAVIDNTGLLRALDEAQNTYNIAVNDYHNNIKTTQKNYEKAQQDYDAAKLNYDRNEVLFQSGNLSSSEMETIENTMNDAKRQLDSFTVKKGKAVPDEAYALKVQSAQYDLDQKKTDLEKAQVQSPISGTVVRVNTKVGQFADKPVDDNNNYKPMFTVENLDGLEMKLAISEYSIRDVHVGQTATISADILGDKTVTGKVTDISPTGEAKSGSSTERVVPTTIRIDGGSSTGLIAGITAKATVVTGEAKDVLKVSQTALIQNPDGSMAVAVVDLPAGSREGTVHLVPVKTGVESDLEAQVLPETDGSLKEGMLVAAMPAGLSDGMKLVVAGH